jgi:serine/threonine-protein kinase
MDAPVSDDDFAAAVVEAGLVTSERLAAMRKELEAARRTGHIASLPHALLRQKLIRADQRDKIEKRIRIAREAIPERFGEYSLLKKLGHGGMGAVFLAQDAAGRRVALKTLAKDLCEDAEARARFKREGQAARELRHPNIVRGLDVGDVEGHPYYAMEFCEGETLEAMLERGVRFAPAQALDVALQVARGLECAHERGFVHRDIKPDNIFWTRDGAAKILDLGLSKNLRVQQSFNTMGGTALGTPNYVSPEQAQAIGELDGRTDQYSLAATLHHLLTGEPPFDAPDFMKVLVRQINEQLPDPRDQCPDVPEGFVQVLTRMLAKDPSDRYPDMKAVRADLERVKAGQTPACEPLDPALSTLAMRAAPAAQAPVKGQAGRARIPWRVALIVAAVVGLLGIVLVLVLGRR